MNVKQLVFLLSVLVVLGACRSSRSISSGDTKSPAGGSNACNVQVATTNPLINWKQEREDVLKGSEMMLPESYMVYSADSASLKAFFSAARLSKEGSKAEVVVPLPSPLGCRVFSVYEAGTMSDELKQKFPDIVTLKGADKETPLSDIRMEYNGRMMQGQIMRDGETYYIKPVTVSNKFYYMVYAKSDAREVKKDFEQDKSNNKNIRNDQKPEILRYDR